MNSSEEKTWKNIQQKDKESFERYYKEHYKAFFFLAFKYVKSAEQAQEIVNDIFVKLWQDGHDLIIEVSLKSYICRAIINRSINVLNKNKKDLQNQKELSYRTEKSYEMRQMEESELEIRLYRAINQLPEQCKKVFYMSRFKELKQQEIADQLGISIKTVKNHITHALKLLNKTAGDILIIMLIIKEFFSGWH